MTNLTITQLRQALLLRQRIDKLENELARLFGGASAARRSAARAQTPARGNPWASMKRQTTVAAVKAPKRTISAAGRARIAAAARKRWKLAKAAGKRTLGG